MYWLGVQAPCLAGLLRGRRGERYARRRYMTYLDLGHCTRIGSVNGHGARHRSRGGRGQQAGVKHNPCTQSMAVAGPVIDPFAASLLP
jgi:hypothetical protein